jgi:hypothetical protein
LYLSGCIAGPQSYSENEAESDDPRYNLIENSSACRGIGQREFGQIIKSSDANTGKNVIIYGKISDFTGSLEGYSAFMANAYYKQTEYFGLDGENVYIMGKPSLIDKFVKEDVFRACVAVQKGVPGTTAFGQDTTVPFLLLKSIRFIRADG